MRWPIVNDLNRTQLLEAYKNGASDLQQALATLPNEMWHFKTAPNSWSVHEIVIHLADTEVQSHVRFRTIISEPSTTIPYYDEYQWSEALNYANQDMQISLRIISLMRESNHELLASMPEPLWLNACIHSVRGSETLDTLVRGYVKHMHQHISQMKHCFHSWQATHFA
jgi:uncharacterized damage-inducible protein DinB